MANGNPRLAIWNRGDSVLRIYELAGGAFVQGGSTGVPHGNDIVSPVYLGFTPDGGSLVTISKASLAIDNFVTTARDLTLGSPSSLPLPRNAPNGGANFTSSHTVRPDGSALFRTQDNALTIFDAQSFVSGGIVANGLQTINAGDATVIKFAPDGRTIARIRGSQVAINAITYNAAGTPSYQPNTNLSGFSAQIVALGWTVDSRYLLVGLADGQVVVFSVGATSIAKQDEFSGLSVPVTQIASSPDGTLVAVGYNDPVEGYSTVLFSRRGPFFVEKSTHAGMGRALDWTADSRFLIDATAKRALTVDNGGNFVSADAIMVNVAANAVAQAVSPHRLTSQPTAQLFDAATYPVLADLALRTNIKMTLLGNAALFDRTAQDTVALRVHEVTTGSWPAGGVPVANVNFVEAENGQVKMVADDLERTAIGSAISFRSLLFYDANTDTPLLFVSQSIEPYIADGVTVKVELSGDGFIQFVI